jgi:transcriptional regulator with XRE-family HTH domain
LSPKGMGPRIKRLRKLRGLTQEQLAKAIGVTVIHVANLESPDQAKHHRNPSLPTVEKLAQALKCAVGDLLGERRGKR